MPAAFILYNYEVTAPIFLRQVYGVITLAIAKVYRFGAYKLVVLILCKIA